MKERPILFNALMVRAILDGRKIQTRRVVKPPIKWAAHFPICAPHHMKADAEVWWHGSETEHVGVVQACPYGQPGDRLWVRENFLHECSGFTLPSGEYCDGFEGKGCLIDYCADEPEPKPRTLHPEQYNSNWMVKRPSIHMPRWASRITLDVTEVRVERLTACSAADAIEEGIAVGEPLPEIPTSKGDIYHDGVTDPIDGWTRDPVEAYANLWRAINGPHSWDANPWVWVVEFKRVEVTA